MRTQILLLLLVYGSFAPTTTSHSQGMTPAPLYGKILSYDAKILSEAQANNETAQADERRGDFFNAYQKYKNEIDSWENLPNLVLSYPVLMALAGAHFEATRERMLYTEKSQDLQDLKPRDQNKNLINSHIQSVYKYVGLAASKARASQLSEVEKSKFICDAQKMLATTVSLQGIFNRVSYDIDRGIERYEQLAVCDPDAARKSISYLKRYKREMSNSPVSFDNLAKDMSSLVTAVFPGMTGNAAGWLITRGYRFLKEHQDPPAKVLR